MCGSAGAAKIAATRMPAALRPALVVLTLTMAACSGGGPPGPSGTGSPAAKITPPVVASSPAPCSLPLVSDVYDGYRIGVPAGWSLFTVQGSAVVARDATGSEETVVHPALVSGSADRQALFASLLGLLKQALSGFGVALTSAGSGPAAATLTLSSSKLSAVGEAHLRILDAATAHGDQVAVLVASWAPAARFAGDQAMLTQVGDCYAPEQGAVYHVIKDQVFTYPIPPGWAVGVENQDALELTLGTKASATYVFFQFLQPNTGVNSPQTLMAYEFQKLGIHVDSTLSSSTGPFQPCTAGTCGQETAQFTGSLNGKPVEGLVYLQTSSTSAGASGSMRLGLADAGSWNALNGVLLHLMGGIQHDFSQDIQSWERAEAQWNQFSQQVQGFDYALNNVDLTRDPITGDVWEAGYQAWNQGGPQGPGYYDWLGHKLDVITPS